METIFTIGEKTYRAADAEIMGLVAEATKRKDTGAVIVMLAVGEATGAIEEIEEQTHTRTEGKPC